MASHIVGVGFGGVHDVGQVHAFIPAGVCFRFAFSCPKLDSAIKAHSKGIRCALNQFDGFITDLFLDCALI